MGLGSSLFASEGRTFKNRISSDEYSSSSSSSAGKIFTSSALLPGLEDVMDAEDADQDILDLRQQFHNTVRENVIFLLFFLTLCIISWTAIGIFMRRKDKEDDKSSETVSTSSADDDESIVYRICFWLCVFSLSISMGATLLLPISIISNEVLLLYPSTYYVQWLNGMLIQGLWNLIFLFANISLFILLPFAHLFIESEGFSGNRKGLAGKFYETVVVLILSGFAIWGISHILAAVLSPGERSVLGGLFNLIGFSNQLPFIYSCISFFGVLLLLLCTPLGAGHLFTVLSQLLVGPQFLRNLSEEHRVKALEIEELKNGLKRKLRNDSEMKRYLEMYYEPKDRYNRPPLNGGGGDDAIPKKSPPLDISALKEKWDNGGMSSDEESSTARSPPDVEDLLAQRNPKFVKLYHKMITLTQQGDDFVGESEASVRGRIAGMEEELSVLEKLQKTPGWKRNVLYPTTFLVVLALTGLTVLLVVVNTLQLLVGLKALPLSAQTVSLGLSSMSVLGAWGAGLEIILILYLMTTSLIGLYSLPGVRRIKPRRGETPTSHIIYNCALVLILSSALPLLSRILGITNFDLLGNYGKIEWLGNFYIVFLYNIIFSVASTLCLVNKVTRAIRQELFMRLKSAFRPRFLPQRNNSIVTMGSLRPNSPLNGGRGHSPGVSSPRGGNSRGSPSPPPPPTKAPPASLLDPQQTNNKTPNGNLSTTTPTKRKNSVKSEGTLGGHNGISTTTSKKKNL